MTGPNISEYLLSTYSASKWKSIGFNKRAGVFVPLFCVYSKESVGIGDLEDLKLLIDWVKLTGNSILQLLPMNETGLFTCPYDSVSSFALEPLYLCLKKMQGAKTKAIKAEITRLQKLFPCGLPNLDYSLKQEKINLLRKIYGLNPGSESASFQKFQDINSYWLIDYCLYKVLKENHSGRPWYDWEAQFRDRDKSALKNICAKFALEISFQQWLQWQLYEQFCEAKHYGALKKVLLKGDLPILVSRDSADVWAHPEFFKLDYASGAPPDMYCAKGQRWGMPTYNWEAIANDGFRYLKEKLKYAQNFYDIIRIDHVVGLFRIWSIAYNEPLENMGLHGFFDPQDERIWGEHGRNILKVIAEGTKMLLCAEDLGVIPQVCTSTIQEFGIPGNEVARWVKDWSHRHNFLKPQEYRFLSVAMLSTHDTTNFSAWWENEAGTIDEALFIRKCQSRNIDYDKVRAALFDSVLSRHGRLRWLSSLDTIDKLIAVLGRRNEEVGDFIDLYKNSYQEKEKLWRHLGLAGAMRENSDIEIVRAMLTFILRTNAVFCINTIIDLLYLTDVFKKDPYEYRINTPGTISNLNWSLVIPISLEGLLKHKVNKEIRKLIKDSGRV